MKLIGHNGKVLVSNGKAFKSNAEKVIEPLSVTENGTYTAPSGVDGYSPVTVAIPQRNRFGNNGTVDAEGLRALNWNDNDIAWLQDVCWWDAEDNDYWKVTEANKTKGALITWNNRANYKTDPDIRFFPKLQYRGSLAQAFNGYKYLYAIPTDGWELTNASTDYAFANTYHLISIGNLIALGRAYGSLSISLYSNFLPTLRAIGEFGSDIILNNNPVIGSRQIKELRGLHLVSLADGFNNFTNFLNYAYGLEVLDVPPIPTGCNTANLFPSAPCILRSIPHSGKISASINLSGCCTLDRISVLVLLNALDAEVTGQTITLHADVKALLSEADLQIATDKGWTVA